MTPLPLRLLLASASLVSISNNSMACDISSVSSMEYSSSSILDDGINWQAKFREIEEWWDNAPKQPYETPAWLIRAEELAKEEERLRQEMIEERIRNNANDPRFKQADGDLLGEIRQKAGRVGKSAGFDTSKINKLKKQKHVRKKSCIPDYRSYKEAQQALQDNQLDDYQKQQKRKVVSVYEEFWHRLEREHQHCSDSDVSYEVDSNTERLNAEFVEFVRQYNEGKYTANVNDENKGCGNEELSNNSDNERLEKLASQIHGKKQKGPPPAWQGLDFADDEDVFGYLLDELTKYEQREVFQEAATTAKAKAEKRSAQRAREQRRQLAKEACLAVLKGRQITEQQKRNMTAVLNDILASRRESEEETPQSNNYSYASSDEEAKAENTYFNFAEPQEDSKFAASEEDTSPDIANKEESSFLAEEVIDDITLTTGRSTEEQNINQLSTVSSPSSNLSTAIAIKQKTELLLENSMLHNMIISRRLLQLSAPAAGEKGLSYGIWISGLVGNAKQKSNKGKASGYKGSSRNITIGFDTELKGGQIAGFAAAIASSKLNVAASNNSYKTGSLSLALYHQIPVRVKGLGDYHIDSKIFASNAKLKTNSPYGKGHMSSYLLGARTGATKVINLYNKAKVQFSLLPSIHLGYDFLKTGSFKERGAGSYYMNVRPNISHRAEVSIGARLQGDFRANCGNNVSPEISASITRYRYSKLLPIKGYAQYQGFRVEHSSRGIDPEQKTIFSLGAGMVFGMQDSTLAAYYNCSIAKGYKAEQASLRLRVEI